jgi:biotin operon repressor
MSNIKLDFIKLIKKHTNSKPIKANKIMARFGFESSVQVRALASECRKEGVPILSGRKGYYYPRTIQELDLGISNLAFRRDSLAEQCDALEKWEP